MQHPESWYTALAARLGHPGYADLAEIRQAEARETRETAATAKWKHHPGGPYYTETGGSTYVIFRISRRNWRIEAWPTALGQAPRPTHIQAGIATLTDAENLALNMPCFRCGLGSPLMLMTPCLPARPSLTAGPGNGWKCMDTGPCEAEYNRMTGREEPARIEIGQPVTLSLSDAATGRPAGQITIDPADPACKNSLADEMRT